MELISNMDVADRSSVSVFDRREHVYFSFPEQLYYPLLMLEPTMIICSSSLQDLALSTDEALPAFNRCAVHALAAAYLNLICQLTTVPAFCQHIHEVGLRV